MATAREPGPPRVTEDEFAAMILDPAARDQVCDALVSGIVAHPVVETPPLTYDDLVAAMNLLKSVPRYVLAYPEGQDPVPGVNARLFELVDGAYREIGGADHVVE